MGWFRYDENDLVRLEDRYYKLKNSKIPSNEEFLRENDESHPEYRYWKNVLKVQRLELNDLEREIKEAKRDIAEQKREKEKSGGGWSFW